MAVLELTYKDPDCGVEGYLVIDRTIQGVAAGGFRISPTLTVEDLRALARNMTLKQAVAGIQVGGAKSGLRMAPDHPKRREVMIRFFRMLRPLILEHYSVGPDLNNTLPELESIAREVDIPCLKIAVGRSRQLEDAEFVKRYALLEAPTPLGTVNELRAPMAVAAAVRMALQHLGIAATEARIAIQGAGAMGGGAAKLLNAEGIRVVAWADAEKTLVASSSKGLAVDSLLTGRVNQLLPCRDSTVRMPREAVLEQPCDVLILAAISNALGDVPVSKLSCRAIVQGANLAMTNEAERLAEKQGLVIIPDVISSSGGSIAVEALYSTSPTCGEDILEHVARRASDLVREALSLPREGLTLRQAMVQNAETQLSKLPFWKALPMGRLLRSVHQQSEGDQLLERALQAKLDDLPSLSRELTELQAYDNEVYHSVIYSLSQEPHSTNEPARNLLLSTQADTWLSAAPTVAWEKALDLSEFRAHVDSTLSMKGRLGGEMAQYFFSDDASPKIEAIAVYILHHWFRSRGFYQLLQIFSRRISLDAVGILYENLAEETGGMPGTRPHPRMLEDLLSYLGLPGNRLHPTSSVSLRYLNNRTLSMLAKEPEWGLALLYALEQTTPETHSNIHRMLERARVPEPFRAFHHLHMHCDAEHANGIWKIAETHLTHARSQQTFLRSLAFHQQLSRSYFQEIWHEIQAILNE